VLLNQGINQTANAAKYNCFTAAREQDQDSEVESACACVGLQHN